MLLHYRKNKKIADIFSLQLLEKDASDRLGASTSPHGDITENVFFYEIDWKKLERRQLEPPFKPKIVNITNLNHKKDFCLIVFHYCFFFISISSYPLTETPT